MGLNPGINIAWEEARSCKIRRRNQLPGVQAGRPTPPHGTLNLWKKCVWCVEPLVKGKLRGGEHAIASKGQEGAKKYPDLKRPELDTWDWSKIDCGNWVEETLPIFMLQAQRESL